MFKGFLGEISDGVVFITCGSCRWQSSAPCESTALNIVDPQLVLSGHLGIEQVDERLGCTPDLETIQYQVGSGAEGKAALELLWTCHCLSVHLVLPCVAS